MCVYIFNLATSCHACLLKHVHLLTNQEEIIYSSFIFYYLLYYHYITVTELSIRFLKSTGCLTTCGAVLKVFSDEICSVAQ